jgi:hypothetical protein
MSNRNELPNVGDKHNPIDFPVRNCIGYRENGLWNVMNPDITDGVNFGYHQITDDSILENLDSEYYRAYVNPRLPKRSLSRY